MYIYRNANTQSISLPQTPHDVTRHDARSPFRGSRVSPGIQPTEMISAHPYTKSILSSLKHSHSPMFPLLLILLSFPSTLRRRRHCFAFNPLGILVLPRLSTSGSGALRLLSLRVLRATVTGSPLLAFPHRWQPWLRRLFDGRTICVPPRLFLMGVGCLGVSP